MGILLWNSGYDSGLYTVSPSDMDDVAIESRGKSEYTYDVYPNTGEFCMGGQSGGQTWLGGMEYLGDIPGYWDLARVFACNGDYI